MQIAGVGGIALHKGRDEVAKMEATPVRTTMTVSCDSTARCVNRTHLATHNVGDTHLIVINHGSQMVGGEGVGLEEYRVGRERSVSVLEGLED